MLKNRFFISVTDISTLSGTSYLIVKMADFDEFEIWLKREIKKEKIKRREWVIAIVSAAIGALIGLIPTFINLLAK